jgi:hypothetical protein
VAKLAELVALPALWSLKREVFGKPTTAADAGDQSATRRERPSNRSLSHCGLVSLRDRG